MTDDTKNPGGWPDPSRPGVPMNADQNGDHWLRWNGRIIPFVAFWHAKDQEWQDIGEVHNAVYLGRCLTPAEVAAREAAAKEAGMREAARIAEEAAKDVVARHEKHADAATRAGRVRADDHVLAAEVAEIVMRKIKAAILAAIPAKEPTT